MSVELKPCPKCKSAKVACHPYGFFHAEHLVWCDSCFHLGPRVASAIDAVDLWNALPREPDPGPTTQSLVDDLSRLASEVAALKAEVERSTPKPMTLQEACDVLNRANHAYTSTWRFNDEIGSDGEPLVLSSQGVLMATEAQYIAQGLRRDAANETAALEAEVERSTPREMTPDEIVASLNVCGFRGINGWRWHRDEYEGALDYVVSPGFLMWFYMPEILYIAQGLLRDGAKGGGS